MFVDQVTADVVCITRHDPASRETVVLAAFTAFQYPDPFKNVTDNGINVSGNVDHVILEASLSHK